ncbi:MAG: cold shock domain-containing protein [Pseudomonadota bacterium]
MVKVSRLVSGRVKWYDPEKGYGFVVPVDGGPDVMVHAHCVRTAGLALLDEGQSVSLTVVRGDRGLQATEIVSASEEVEDAPEDLSGGVRPTEIAAEAEPVGDYVAARVKWFNKQKGFGFLNVFGDPADVFVHMETLRRHGFQDLQPGEAVCVRLVAGPRGHMAGELCRWEEVVHP